MKRLIDILLSFILFSGFLNAQSARKTVAVLNFENAGGVEKNEVSILTDRFSSSLFNTSIYKVLEREKMNEVLKAQDFNMSDACTTTECVMQVGQLLGVEFMVAGKVGKFGQVYTIDIRMIDVSTGELLKTVSENYDGKKEGLLGLIASMASTIANKADISAESLEAELAKLQEQNRRLEQEKNLKAQEENAKKQEELKAQLAALEQNKKLENQQKAKTEAEKQKAAEEQKRKQNFL
jgi:TolB-like protein